MRAGILSVSGSVRLSVSEGGDREESELGGKDRESTSAKVVDSLDEYCEAPKVFGRAISSSCATSSTFGGLI